MPNNLAPSTRHHSITLEQAKRQRDNYARWKIQKWSQVHLHRDNILVRFTDTCYLE